MHSFLWKKINLNNQTQQPPAVSGPRGVPHTDHSDPTVCAITPTNVDTLI